MKKIETKLWTKINEVFPPIAIRYKWQEALVFEKEQNTFDNNSLLLQFYYFSSDDFHVSLF
jgi:hypothetical protein